jgi:hypothetical protein
LQHFLLSGDEKEKEKRRRGDEEEKDSESELFLQHYLIKDEEEKESESEHVVLKGWESIWITEQTSAISHGITIGRKQTREN